LEGARTFKLDSNSPIKLAVMYLAVILFPSNLIVD